MRLGVLGPGSLGLSAAQHAAERGLEVRLLGRDEAHASLGLARIQGRWARSRPATELRITACAADAASMEGLDILLEALPEDLELKAAAWRSIAPTISGGTLLLSGTSSLPVGALSRAAGLEGRLLGFHLFVPVARMGIVEIVIPKGTGPELAHRTEAFADALGLRAVRVADQAGFAAARMALAQGLEAMRLLESGAASAEDLDALMVHGYGHPMGPLELSDRVGLDLRLKIAEILHRETGDPRFEAPELLRAKVAAGELGRKSGRGFFSWGADGRRL
ncbi:MAG TPA: 3-hydroxyacyl-CoA dehydrogenase family protein [Holophagaceae bacterium]|nr:3-hydroxyacyl-CoA dehydrogenase family protein [Holophagaceae bacterium]